MARRRIRTCSIPSTVHAHRPSPEAFLALLRTALLDLKQEQFERLLDLTESGTMDQSV
jgi:hypothetical protein